VNDAERLVRAVDGWVAEWSWAPGLTPDVVAGAFDIEFEPQRIRVAGHDRLGAMLHLPDRPQPVRFMWDVDRELWRVDISRPTLQPSVTEALAALGEPTSLGARNGPHAGSHQQVHLDRGVTIFDGRKYGITHVWLFKPTDLDTYVTGFAATQNIRRMR
jgi:hypothetical protein